jgi:uncharacterized tellurite resistance protein B-like protein
MESTEAADRAMEGWLGTLGHVGVIDAGADDEGSTALANFVVGEEGVETLRGFFADATREIRDRERRAAIEICIWMMHADRKVDPEEVAMIREIIGRSGLPDDVQDELVQGTHEPPSLEGVEDRLTQPALRELLLALCWELASVDGNVAKAERDFYTGMSKRLGVGPARAAEIQRSMAERVG